jgi:hypothetical protein
LEVRRPHLLIPFSGDELGKTRIHKSTLLLFTKYLNKYKVYSYKGIGKGKSSKKWFKKCGFWPESTKIHRIHTLFRS